MNTFRPGGLTLTQKAAESIGLQSGERILDVGCGTGATLRFLTDTYQVEAYGADISPAAVNRAGEGFPEGRVVAADACALPFEDGSFDAVFLECVLTLIEKPHQALAEAARVLRPGGRLVLSGLYAKKEDGPEIHRQGLFFRGGLAKALANCGFSIAAQSDESASLIQLVADAVFHYGSLASYVAAASRELDGCVLGCDTPVKGTGYLLLTAKKTGDMVSGISGKESMHDGTYCN